MTADSTTALGPATAHTSWCDPTQHVGSSTTEQNSNSQEQACVSEVFLPLDQNTTGHAGTVARLSLIQIRPDDPDEESQTTLSISINGWDAFPLEESQIEPLARGLLERLATWRGGHEPAARWHSQESGDDASSPIDS
ncbi:hypothetical protein ABH935_005740 [Catenulispora sp. GAS73]|uniref:hypothetical protein n=1 Tax=Catenulispora sp. GAS73 TaxID=3156269 RepID=UPI0035172C3C